MKAKTLITESMMIDKKFETGDEEDLEVMLKYIPGLSEVDEKLSLESRLLLGTIGWQCVAANAKVAIEDVSTLPESRYNFARTMLMITSRCFCFNGYSNGCKCILLWVRVLLSAKLFLSINYL
jgi:hypothetical protein